MPVSADKNGLLLSSQSNSGYKFVTTLTSGSLTGKFVAFAEVVGDERQYQNTRNINRVEGFVNVKNVAVLGVFDDVRDAAYVAQHFYGENNAERNANLDALFEGNKLAIPSHPYKNWSHEPDYEYMKKAQQRAANRVVLDVQAAIAKFNSGHKGEYNVSLKEAATIRASMNAYLGTLDNPKNDDLMEAARLAFEPYLK